MAINAGGFIGPKSATEPAGALTAAELREALPGNVSLERAEALLETASALVDRYADTAPQPVKNEATIRLAAWLKQSPSSDFVPSSVGSVDFEWRPTASRNALRNSGAAGLLSPWRRPRGLVVGDE